MQVEQTLISNIYRAIGLPENVALEQDSSSIKGKSKVAFNKIARQVKLYVADLAEHRGGDKGSGDMKRIEVEVLEGIDKNPILLNHIRSNY